MNLLKLASITAILFSITFFAHSLLNLIGFAVSTQAIAPNAIPSQILPAITSLLANFSTLTRTFILLEALLGTIILFTFERIAIKKKSSFLRITAILFLIATLLPGISVFFSIMQLPFSLSDKMVLIFSGILSIFFGIALIRIRASWKILSTSLGILYILEGIIIISTYWIPVRLLEFSIAIALIEAVFFWKIGKQL